MLQSRSRGSSVSIVSGYGLDDRATEVRSSAEARDFSSNLCVQIGSGAHPATCPMGTGGLFPGGKVRPGRDAGHSPHLVPRSWMSRSYISFPLCACKVCCGTALTFYITDPVTVYSLCANIRPFFGTKPVFMFYMLVTGYSLRLISCGVSHVIRYQPTSMQLIRSALWLAHFPVVLSLLRRRDVMANSTLSGTLRTLVSLYKPRFD
jgi:hypothetical protein